MRLSNCRKGTSYISKIDSSYNAEIIIYGHYKDTNKVIYCRMVFNGFNEMFNEISPES